MESINILLAGDFCPILRIEELTLEDKAAFVFNDFLTYLRRSDLTIINLECPLVEEGDPIKKTGPNLKASPRNIELLKFAGIDLVAMANNHIMDFGSDSLLGTVSLLQDNGISTVGVGRNLLDAQNPFSTRIKDRSLSVLNFAENEWSNTHGTSPGANPLDVVTNYYAIQEAKRESDIVLVIYHGGNEFYHLPSPRLKKTLRFFVDAGASAVITHHTHVSTGYEIYKDVPIFYGLGNFCYDTEQKPNEEWNRGFAVMLHIRRKAEFEIIPFDQNGIKPGIHLLQGKEKEDFEERIRLLKEIIADDSLLEDHFKKYCIVNEFRYDQIFEPYHSSFLVSLRKRGLFPSLITRRRKRLLLNVIRCEAHRDVLLAYLKKYQYS